MRRLGWAVALTLAVLVQAVPLGLPRSAPWWVGESEAGIVRTYRVACTATTSHLATASDSRAALTFVNQGTINVYLGGTAIDNTSPHLTLHVGSTLSSQTLEEAKAGWVCNTAGGYAGTGSAVVDVTEISR